MKEALRRLWHDRAEREQVALRAGAAVIALAIAYAYVWLPAARERGRLITSVPQLRAAAQDMERDAAELARMKETGRKALPLDLKQAIELTASATGMTLRAGEIEHHGTERARVLLTTAQTAESLAFVARLQSAQGVRVERLRMTPKAGSEHVSLEAVLARAP